MVIWVFAGGGEAEVGKKDENGIIPFLNEHFKTCYFERKTPVRHKPGAKPNQKLDAHGKTDKSLRDQIRRKLKELLSFKDSCDLILVIDDLDCRNAEEQKKIFLQEINGIDDTSGIEKLIAFASPELEAWLVADWDNTFAKNPYFQGCHKNLQYQLSTQYNLDFKSPESFSQFDSAKQTCKDKISEIIKNLSRSNGCKKEFSKGADTPVLLQMIYPEVVAAKCPLFKDFYYTLKGLCQTQKEF